MLNLLKMKESQIFYFGESHHAHCKYEYVVLLQVLVASFLLLACCSDSQTSTCFVPVLPWMKMQYCGDTDPQTLQDEDADLHAN